MTSLSWIRNMVWTNRLTLSALIDSRFYLAVPLWLRRKMKRPAKRGARRRTSGEPLCPKCRQVWGDKVKLLWDFVWRLPRQETISHPATLEEAFFLVCSVSFSFPFAFVSDPLFLAGWEAFGRRARGQSGTGTNPWHGGTCAWSAIARSGARWGLWSVVSVSCTCLPCQDGRTRNRWCIPKIKPIGKLYVREPPPELSQACQNSLLSLHTSNLIL